MICSLCGIFSKNPLIEAKTAFCCSGCRAVYKILETRNEAFHKEHPLYLEALKEGIISNPNLEEKKDFKRGERHLFEISGMGCPSCAEVIGYFLNKTEGIFSAKIDYATDLALIDYDPMKTGLENIFKRIKSIGYEARDLNDKSFKERRLLLELGVASFCAMNLMMLAYPLYFLENDTGVLFFLSFLLSLPVVFFSAIPFYKRAFQALRAGHFGMDLLISASILSAFVLSTYNLINGINLLYYETLSIVAAFLIFGKWVEKQAKESGKERFYEMIRFVPQSVSLEGGEKRFLKDIKKGDRLILTAGQMAPILSKIKKGEVWISEQAVNGESAPKFYKEGDVILSGSIAESGSVIIEALEAYEKSLLNHILEACELSFNRRMQGIEALNWFVPGLLSLSMLTFFIFGFERALAVLLISCPCAIGLAAPLVRSRLLKAFADNDALVRNFDAFENLAKAELFIFDKTGTVTEGRLTLVRLPKHQAIVKGLSLNSHHPLAKSLRGLEGPVIEFDRVKEHIGKGIEGIKEDKIYLLGSPSFLKEKGVECEMTSNLTHVILAIDGNAVECLEFEDVLKEKLDLPEPRILLSGDNERAVALIAKRLGFKEWLSEKTPLEKEAFIRSVKARSVYIGDGLNDAPSLAASPCGIACGDALSLTQAAADILLVTGDLNRIKPLQKLAKAGQKKIRENFFWAFIYNLACIPLAMFGYLNPIIASIAMVLSSLFVIINSCSLEGVSSWFKKNPIVGRKA